jgi:hypothetical protein
MQRPQDTSPRASSTGSDSPISPNSSWESPRIILLPPTIVNKQQELPPSRPRKAPPPFPPILPATPLYAQQLQAELREHKLELQEQRQKIRLKNQSLVYLSGEVETLVNDTRAKDGVIVNYRSIVASMEKRHQKMEKDISELEECVMIDERVAELQKENRKLKANLVLAIIIAVVFGFRLLCELKGLRDGGLPLGDLAAGMGKEENACGGDEEEEQVEQAFARGVLEKMVAVMTVERDVWAST